MALAPVGSALQTLPRGPRTVQICEHQSLLHVVTTEMPPAMSCGLLESCGFRCPLGPLCRRHATPYPGFCESEAWVPAPQSTWGRRPSPALGVLAFLCLQDAQSSPVFGCLQKETVWGKLQLWLSHNGLPEARELMPGFRPGLGSRKYRTHTADCLVALPRGRCGGRSPLLHGRVLPHSPHRRAGNSLMASRQSGSALGAFAGLFRLIPQ